MLIPAVAESWHTSGDGRVWTFSLAAHAAFHDGRPVQSADVIASWERVLAFGPRSTNGWILDPILGAAEFRRNGHGIAGLEAPDARTLRVT